MTSSACSHGTRLSWTVTDARISSGTIMLTLPTRASARSRSWMSASLKSRSIVGPRKVRRLPTWATEVWVTGTEVAPKPPTTGLGTRWLEICGAAAAKRSCSLPAVVSRRGTASLASATTTRTSPVARSV
jgi:hypothetical protein